MTGVVNAAFLNIKTETCMSSWYCTNYDQKECGHRNCIDVNACELYNNKPQENLRCENSQNLSTHMILGYFELNTDIIRVEIEQEKIVQKIIKINTTTPQEYFLDINYPTSYTKGTDFFTTSKNKKYVESLGDFNIIIDSRNIIVGTYVIPVRIYNANYSRTILAIVNVVPKNNPKIEIIIDSTIKTSIPNEKIEVETNIRKANIMPGDKITYSIIDPKGNTIIQQDRSIDSSKIFDSIPLLPNLEEGYYTLSIQIETNSGVYNKNKVFSILTPDKYSFVIQDLPKTHYITIIIIAVLSLMGFLITFFNTNLFYKRNRFSRRYIYHRGTNRFRITMGKPNIDMTLGVKEMIKKLKEVFRSKPIIDPIKKADLLKRSYDRGFISLKEYHDAISIQGEDVDERIISKHHKEIIMEKEEERIAKQTRQEKNQEKELLKDKEEKEKQQREMGKAEAEILKQEEELKKELIYQKEEKERIDLEDKKKREEEKIKELKVEREIKQLKEEILIEQKEIQELKEKTNIEDVRETKSTEKILNEPKTPMPIEIKERTIVSPMAHLMVKEVAKEKENILDKKVHNNQSFGLNNGEKLYSLRDLLKALPHMPEHVFEHHTKHGRNDFANWTGDVFKYYDIAKLIREADNREELIRVLKEYE
jgi:hypothetical protein